nr:MAG TPA: hypothetical protein [Caudoviricetes sp.]
MNKLAFNFIKLKSLSFTFIPFKSLDFILPIHSHPFFLHKKITVISSTTVILFRYASAPKSL